MLRLQKKLAPIFPKHELDITYFNERKVIKIDRMEPIGIKKLAPKKITRKRRETKKLQIKERVKGSDSRPILPKSKKGSFDLKRSVSPETKVIIPVRVKTFVPPVGEQVEPSHPVIKMVSGPAQRSSSNTLEESSGRIGNVISESFVIDEPIDENIITGNTEVQCKTDQDIKLCQVCGKTLKGASSLKSHLQSHREDKPYVCEYCNKTFKRSNHLAVHIRTHTADKRFGCELCPFRTTHSSNLKRHQLTHNIDKKEFQCAECGRVFPCKFSLTGHLKLHKNVDHKCDICDKVYHSARSLSNHKLYHGTLSRKFNCDLCSKTYLFKSLLEKHMDGHKGIEKYACPLCDARFVWRSSLGAHIRTHSEKKYECSICSASFKREKSYTTHLSKHFKPSVHQCDKCKREFKYKYLLQEHKKAPKGCPKILQVKVSNINDKRLPSTDGKPEAVIKDRFRIADYTVLSSHLNDDIHVGISREFVGESMVDPQPDTNTVTLYDSASSRSTSVVVESSYMTPMQTIVVDPKQQTQNLPLSSSNPNMIHMDDPYLNHETYNQVSPSLNSSPWYSSYINNGYEELTDDIGVTRQPLNSVSPNLIGHISPEFPVERSETLDDSISALNLCLL